MLKEMIFKTMGTMCFVSLSNTLLEKLLHFKIMMTRISGNERSPQVALISCLLTNNER